MGYRCENCGQPAAPGDVSCWHCGRPFAQPVPGQPAVSGKAASRPPEVTLYASLTAGLVVAAMILMVLLGRQPLVQLTSSAPLPPDWQTITDSQQRFTLNLPQSWVWWNSQAEQQQAAFTAQRQNDVDLGVAMRPWGQLVNDLTVTLVATAGDEAGPFLVVAYSKLLNRLSTQQALAAVQQSGLAVVSAAYVPDFDKSHLAISLDVDGGDQTWRCDQQFVNGRNDAWLAAVCAPVEGYGRAQSTVQVLLSSFQVLRPG
ncbi:MAG: zinc ribbon domain-containing protein [Chloroflexota bacterium]